MDSNVREIKYITTEEDIAYTVRKILELRLHMSSREITRCKQFEDGVMVERASGTGLVDHAYTGVEGDGSARENMNDMAGVATDEYVPIWLRDTVYVGDTLRVRIYEDVDNAGDVPPSDGPIDIIYEDEDLILLNKPGDMAVHPSYAHYRDSLSNALAGYYDRTGRKHVIRTIGRLDRETSGLIIFAKNRHSAAVLSDQTKNMSRRKEYLALCSGIFSEKDGTIDAPIGEEAEQRMIRKVMESGKEAITHYHVEKQFSDFALVRLHLDTGRTHQIRVHMQYAGHPLLGDNFYGKEISDHHGMTRAALHAARLEFLHPVTGKELCFEAPLPVDMEGVIAASSGDVLQ